MFVSFGAVLANELRVLLGFFVVASFVLDDGQVMVLWSQHWLLRCINVGLGHRM